MVPGELRDVPIDELEDEELRRAARQVERALHLLRLRRRRLEQLLHRLTRERPRPGFRAG